MSRNGSTRAWRKVRAFVLDRDGHRCRRPLPPDGRLCGKPATHAGHIVADVLGGTDHPDNLRAECAGCNQGEAPRLASYRKAPR